jgi:RNA polymerase sigma-70 factor (ECF subfamily)
MAWTPDTATFDRLVREHLPACQRFAVRLTGNVDAAEEVVQDAMLRATRGRHTFRGQSRFQTWLFRILLNAWHDRRGPTGGREQLPDLPDPRNAGPIGDAVGRELGEHVAQAVSTLPARQREVVVLIVYEGLSTADAASVLGTTEQNVRVNLHYGRERLREKLKAFMPEEQSRERR